MVAINDAVAELAAVFGRDGEDLGRLTSADRTVRRPRSGLSGQLAGMYALLDLAGGPQIGGVLSLEIVPSDRLGRVGEYLPRPDDGRARTMELEVDRRPVVFALRYGNPVSVEPTLPESPVHGNVVHLRRRLAPSLAQFLHVLAVVMELERDEFALRIRDEDSNLLPDYTGRLTSVVAAELAADDLAGFLWFFGN